MFGWRKVWKLETHGIQGTEFIKVLVMCFWFSCDLWTHIILTLMCWYLGKKCIANRFKQLLEFWTQSWWKINSLEGVWKVLFLHISYSNFTFFHGLVLNNFCDVFILAISNMFQAIAMTRMVARHLMLTFMLWKTSLIKQYLQK